MPLSFLNFESDDGPIITITSRDTILFLRCTYFELAARPMSFLLAAYDFSFFPLLELAPAVRVAR